MSSVTIVKSLPFRERSVACVVYVWLAGMKFGGGGCRLFGGKLCSQSGKWEALEDAAGGGGSRGFANRQTCLCL